MNNNYFNMNVMIANQLEIADCFLKRFIGLLGKKKMDDNAALLLVPCNSVHTFFMQFAIDVVFLDQNNNVVHLLPYLKPYRISPIVKDAYQVVELPAGTINKYNIVIGDQVRITKQ